MGAVKHKDVGPQLTQEEWLNEDTHYFPSGTSFPANPKEGDTFWNKNDKTLYIYDGSKWVPLGPYAVYK